MNKLRLILISALLVVTTSCVSTKLKVDGSITKEPKDALLSGLSINISTDGNILTFARDLQGMVGLEAFGFKAEENIAIFLGKHGFNQVVDHKIATRNDINYNIHAKSYWHHPDTSKYISTYFTGQSLGFNKKNHIQRIKGDSDINYFIFADITIAKHYAFGYFSGRPRAYLKVVIVDQFGKKVLSARAHGDGKGSIIGINQSKENLELALKRALYKFKNL